MISENPFILKLHRVLSPLIKDVHMTESNSFAYARAIIADVAITLIPL